MSVATDQVRPALTRTEQKELLALACRADRLAWRQACRPLPASPWQRATELVRLIEPFRPLFPHRMSRWLRGLQLIGSLGRGFARFKA